MTVALRNLTPTRLDFDGHGLDLESYVWEPFETLLIPDAVRFTPSIIRLIANGKMSIVGDDVSSPVINAYDIAVQQGFEGDIAEWLESLQGPPGPQGPQGQQGPVGLTGAPGETGPQGQTGSPGIVISPSPPPPATPVVWADTNSTGPAFETVANSIARSNAAANGAVATANAYAEDLATDLEFRKLNTSELFGRLVTAIREGANINVVPDGTAGTLTINASGLATAADLDNTFGIATGASTAIADHTALTTSAHGGIVASNDPRLSDARTPLAHTHGPADIINPAPNAYVLGRVSGSAGAPSEAVPLTTTATASTVAYRGTGGVLSVGTPTANGHAATKEYVDTTVASAVANNISAAQGITRAEYLDPGFVPTPGVFYVITGE